MGEPDKREFHCNKLITTVRVAYYEPAYYEHSFIMN